MNTLIGNWTEHRSIIGIVKCCIKFRGDQYKQKVREEEEQSDDHIGMNSAMHMQQR